MRRTIGIQQIFDDETKQHTPLKKVLSAMKRSDETTSNKGPKLMAYFLFAASIGIGLIGFVHQIYMSTSLSSSAVEFSINRRLTG